MISWKGLPAHEAIWEVREDFQQQFSDFHLEDKLDLEECNDRPLIILQYSRKGKKGKPRVKGNNAIGYGVHSGARVVRGNDTVIREFGGESVEFILVLKFLSHP